MFMIYNYCSHLLVLYYMVSYNGAIKKYIRQQQYNYLDNLITKKSSIGIKRQKQ